MKVVVEKFLILQEKGTKIISPSPLLRKAIQNISEKLIESGLGNEKLTHYLTDQVKTVIELRCMSIYFELFIFFLVVNQWQQIKMHGDCIPNWYVGSTLIASQKQKKLYLFGGSNSGGESNRVFCFDIGCNL